MADIKQILFVDISENFLIRFLEICILQYNKIHKVFQGSFWIDSFLVGLLVIFFCMGFQTEAGFSGHIFRTGMFQHEIRVPRG